MAWKTGTSAGLRDAWTVAWNPEWTVGVWGGRADGKPSPALVGRTMAVPVAAAVFRALCPGGEGPRFERPAGVVRRRVCAESGFVATAACPETREEDAIAHRTLRRLCPLRHGKGGGGEETSAAPASVSAPAASLRILRPAEGSVYCLLPDASPALAQEIPLEAQCPGATELYWLVDGRFFAKSAPSTPVYWPLSRGPHRITCANPDGPSATVRITVE